MSALYTYYFGMMDLGAPSQLPEMRKRKEPPADVSAGQLRLRRGSYEEMTFFVKSTIILIHRVSRVNLAHSVQVLCFGLRCWVAFRIYRFAYHTLVIALHLHWYFAHSLNVLIASSVSCHHSVDISVEKQMPRQTSVVSQERILHCRQFRGHEAGCQGQS